jgi:glyoxylase-like metal-dependent hydrolase (beta-lactamase superfamily II)
MKSCVGAPQGCQWWSSSELLPTTAGPRAPRPIIGIINTSDDPDHVGGNAVLSAAGRAYGVRNIDNSVPGAYVVAHENMTLRLTKDGKQNLVASETYFGNEKKLNFVNGEGVVITHPESAHTDGDSIVYFRRSDVIAAGDIFLTTTYPVIDIKAGGSLNGVIAGLNRILDICIPKEKQEGGTMVIPGHGRISDEADVLEYRDMLTIIRDRGQDAIKKGRTLQQVRAAGLTKDYDGRYGTTTGAWTTAMFIEAAYVSLKAN